MKRMVSRFVTACVAAVLAQGALAGEKPLKVYILAGQSNMEGHAKVETFDYIGEDPATAPLLKEMRGPDGKLRVCDIKRVYPGYHPEQGFELAGFVWFQGWNDMVDGHTYPHTKKSDRYDEYANLMAHFIRDVRKELATPRMPFVIGVMGVGGVQEKPNHFRLSMAKAATLPEFSGNVVAVETAPYWDKALGDIDAKRGKVRQMRHFLRSKHKNHANKGGTMTKEQQAAYVKEFQAKLISKEEEAMWKRGASNAGYHYLGCGKTMAQIGKAFAEALATASKQ